MSSRRTYLLARPSQLLLALMLVCVNTNVLLGATVQRITNSRQPRRTRRLLYRTPQRARSIFATRGKSPVDSHVRPHQVPPTERALAIAAAPPPRHFGSSRLCGDSCDLARAIAFPPRYLLFCRFLC